MKQFKYTINGNVYEVSVGDIKDNIVDVTVNGDSYQVAMEPEKKEGILTDVAPGLRKENVKGILDEYVKRTNRTFSVCTVHRLDRGTSGLLVFAKRRDIQKIFTDNWQNIVKKARQLDHDAAAFLCQHKDLVVDEVAGLIGVKGDAVFSIDVHAALVQRYGTVSSLVHDKYLQNVLYSKGCIFLSLALS